ncbi:MAG: hypothetical protein ABI233_10870 [Chthoniobacterales bacterium]
MHRQGRAAYLENEETRSLFEDLLVLDRVCIDEGITVYLWTMAHTPTGSTV